jgi:heme oxygenase
MTGGSTFPSRLREATRTHHDAVERSVDLIESCRSLEGYRRLLGRFLGFYEPAEARLAPWLEGLGGIDFAARRKSRLLARDLAVLGVDPATFGSLPRCRELPELTGRAQALGCMYVLEGATLGGQYIAKHVNSALGLTAGDGCSFFHSYGDDVWPMWKAFRAVLAEQAVDDAHEWAITELARQTFASFERWFLSTAAG